MKFNTYIKLYSYVITLVLLLNITLQTSNKTRNFFANLFKNNNNNNNMSTNKSQLKSHNNNSLTNSNTNKSTLKLKDVSMDEDETEPKKIYTPENEHELKTQDNESSEDTDGSAADRLDGKQYKIYYLNRLAEYKGQTENPLNLATYKNLVLAKREASFYISKSDSSPELDLNFQNTAYIYTINYKDMELPCMNREYVCLYKQIVGEYRPSMPELNYDIPNEILQLFGEQMKVMERCIILTYGPNLNLSDAMWLCHEEAEIILQLQEDLSALIKEAQEKEDGEMYVDYVLNGDQRIPGIISLTADEFKFSNEQKKLIIEKKYEFLHTGYGLFNKENLAWIGDSSKEPESDRCFKFYTDKRNEEFNFCVYWEKNDLAKKQVLNVLQARWYALFYAQKFNSRLQSWKYSWALEKLSKQKNSLEVDSKYMAVIKERFRNNYFAERHRLVRQFKKKLITKEQLKAKIAALKKKHICAACNNIALCKRALNYSIDKGLLPLRGKREKFAMDQQNPYDQLMKKFRMKVNNVPMGKGRALVEAAANAKGASKYWGQQFPENGSGDTPNMSNLKKAFNAFMQLRESKHFNSMADFSKMCNPNKRNNMKNIKRKVGMMLMTGTNSPYLNYLGHVKEVGTGHNI